MMKRNDGYALPFVLVVMVVVCLIAVSVMSFSLRCLQSQQASIERMQEKYTAMGEVEKVIAQIENATPDKPYSLRKTATVYCEGKVLVVSFSVNGTQVGYRIQLSEAPSFDGNAYYTFASTEIVGYAPLEQGGADE